LLASASFTSLASFWHPENDPVCSAFAGKEPSATLTHNAAPDIVLAKRRMTLLLFAKPAQSPAVMQIGSFGGMQSFVTKP
jgi:hypothetical protein